MNANIAHEDAVLIIIIYIIIRPVEIRNADQPASCHSSSIVFRKQHHITAAINAIWSVFNKVAAGRSS